MIVIATVCAAFPLTISEAKTETETKCICKPGGKPDAAATLSVKAAGHLYGQTGVFHTSRGHKPRGQPVHQGRPRHMLRLAQLPETYLKL